MQLLSKWKQRSAGQTQVLDTLPWHGLQPPTPASCPRLNGHEEHRQGQKLVGVKGGTSAH